LIADEQDGMIVDVVPEDGAVPEVDRRNCSAINKVR